MSRLNDPSQSSENASSTDQLRDKASEVQQGIRDLGSQVKGAASEQFNQLKGQASDYYEQGRQRAEDFEHSIEDYVQQKPIQSLLIAGGVGLLLGILWKRS